MHWFERSDEWMNENINNEWKKKRIYFWMAMNENVLLFVLRMSLLFIFALLDSAAFDCMCSSAVDRSECHRRYVNKWIWIWLWIFACEGNEMFVESRSSRPNNACMRACETWWYRWTWCDLNAPYVRFDCTRGKLRLRSEHVYCLFRQRSLIIAECSAGYARHHSYQRTHEYCINAKLLFIPIFNWNVS